MCSVRDNSHEQGRSSEKDAVSRLSPHGMANNGWGKVPVAG
jgi:hypothetical protein